MNLSIEQKRVETYRGAPDDIRDLYVSDTLTALVDQVYQTFQITQPFRALSEIIGDTILGFYKISDMPRLFQQKLGVSADESQRMVSQLIEQLTPVVKREEQEATTKKESLQNLAQKFENPTPTPVSTPPAPTPVTRTSPTPEITSIPSAPVSQTASIPEAPHAQTNSAIPPAPSLAPEQTENVEPIRTMEGDISRIHGYGAYRDMQNEGEDTEAGN